MFLISGTRAGEKKLGHVADYCQICQAIKPFQLSRMGIGEHLYFLPFGASTVTGHTATCHDCKVRMNVNAVCYSGIAKKPGYDVESLIQETFPTVLEIHAGRLTIARLLLEGKLKSSEREVMLMDLWQKFALHTEEKTGKGIQLGGKGGWGILITFAIAVLLAISTFWLPPAWHGGMFQAMGIAILIGTIYSVIQMALDPGRASREILAALALSLKPFAPSREEVVNYLDRLKRAGFKLGKKIKPDALMAAISTHDAPPFTLRVD